MSDSGDKFISEAVKRPGNLRAWVSRMYGEEGFIRHGNRAIIKPSIIAQVARGKCPICGLSHNRCVCPSRLTKQEANFAQTLEKIRERTLRRIDG